MRYEFDRVVDRRGTSSLKWDYSERLTGVPDLLPLWVADMDFPAPPEIQDAIRRRVEHGIYGYSLEPESYHLAFQAWLGRRHGWNVAREWMLDSPGVVPALSAAILALTRPGEGIIIQPPVYYPFAQRIRANGRRVVENPLLLRGQRWLMDLEGLERVIDRDTRMLVLCSPHNPAARVWSRAELEDLARICLERGILIVSDEIHHDLVMPGYRHVPMALLSDDVASTCVTLCSATKTFNLAGFGGSVTIVSDPELRKRIDAVQRAVFPGLPDAIGIVAMEAAWREGDRWLEELLLYVEGNCRRLLESLAARLPEVSVLPLEGTYLPLLDVRALGLSDDEVTDRLRRAGLWLDDGPMFGAGGKGFQRLNLACPRQTLDAAIERLVRALG